MKWLHVTRFRRRNREFAGIQNAHALRILPGLSSLFKSSVDDRHIELANQSELYRWRSGEDWGILHQDIRSDVRFRFVCRNFANEMLAIRRRNDRVKAMNARKALGAMVPARAKCIHATTA
jgi:hypothetical protein